jgi:hypothetical protein
MVTNTEDAKVTAVEGMLGQAGFQGCALLTEEGSGAPWRAAARELLVGACAGSMVIRATRRAVRRWLYQAGCAGLTEEGSRALWRAAAR